MASLLPTHSDGNPTVPPFRTFRVWRSMPEGPSLKLSLSHLSEVLVQAHGYDTDHGVARFFIFAIELRDEAQGPVVVQYIHRAFKEWAEIEEVYETSGLTH